MGSSIREAQADDAEALVHLPQKKKTSIRADLGPPEINHDGAVEVGPQGLFLAWAGLMGLP